MSSTRKIVIFSLDNTLRESNWRLNHLPRGNERKDPKKWMRFHSLGYKDEPIKAILNLFKMYEHSSDYEIQIWANSVEACRDDVRRWFSHNGVPANRIAHLYLRQDGNQLSNKETYERWLRNMTSDELGRVEIVVTNDDALAEVFAETHIDVLKLNGVDTL